ncbi:MAG: SAM-dependent chlorinase/fluorinase [Anaerolineae bacterium]|nr:SAM-dependent chlorinase/fluorinase [Anaerolineae bacterium]
MITLMTDFGLDDVYVAVMKGVISGIAPGAAFVDLCHAVAPQDIRGAAFRLWMAVPYFPAHTVHLVVVDPGVGTSRRAIAARTSQGIFVGPDNGVFSYVWAESSPRQVVELENPRYHLPGMSTTFHGRDIFSPAAAHVAVGVDLGALGPEVTDPVGLPLPSLELTACQIAGEVLYVDRFGNAITSIGRLTWDRDTLLLEGAFGGCGRARFRASGVQVVAGRRQVYGIHGAYGEVSVGTALALVGSSGLLELAVSQGHGAQALDLQVGDPVMVVGDIEVEL